MLALALLSGGRAVRKNPRMEAIQNFSISYLNCNDVSNLLDNWRSQAVSHLQVYIITSFRPHCKMKHDDPALLDAYKRTKINLFTDAWNKQVVYANVRSWLPLHGEGFNIAILPLWMEDQGLADMRRANIISSSCQASRLYLAAPRRKV